MKRSPAAIKHLQLMEKVTTLAAALNVTTGAEALAVESELKQLYNYLHDALSRMNLHREAIIASTRRSLGID